MTIQPTDLLYVHRGTTSYKLAFQDKAKLQPGDRLLVQRGATPYWVAYRDVAKCRNTDLFLVGRGNTDYKATWATVEPELAPQPLQFTQQPVIGYRAADNALEVQTAPQAGGGAAPYTWGAYAWEMKLPGATKWVPFDGNTVTSDSLVRVGISCTDANGSSVKGQSNEIYYDNFYFDVMPHITWDAGTRTLSIAAHFLGASGVTVVQTDKYREKGATTWIPFTMGSGAFPFTSGKTYEITSHMKLTSTGADGRVIEADTPLFTFTAP